MLLYEIFCHFNFEFEGGSSRRCKQLAPNIARRMKAQSGGVKKKKKKKEEEEEEEEKKRRRRRALSNGFAHSVKRRPW